MIVLVVVEVVAVIEEEKEGIVPYYPRKSEGICFYWRWFVCLSMCLSVTTITKTIVDRFEQNFMGRFLGGKGSPSFVTIGRGMWK